MNKITGRLVASGKAKYLPAEKKGEYSFKDGTYNLKVPESTLEFHGISKEAIDDCLKKLQEKTFEELCKEHGYKDKDGSKPQDGELNAGVVIVSDLDPRVCLSASFGSKWHNDSDYFWLNKDPIDMTLEWFLDTDNLVREMGAGAVPERAVDETELDLISKIREATKEQPKKKEESKSFFRPILERISSIVTTKVLSEDEEEIVNIAETGEPDQDYDTKAYDAICDHIKKSGFECKHKEFDKYQGVFIDVSKAGQSVSKLWTQESYVVGDAKPSKAKYKSAVLVGPEGEESSANKGDYFQLPDTHEFEGNVLVLVGMDGKKIEIQDPQVKDLPDLGDVQSGVEFNGKPDDVIVLVPEDVQDAEFHVRVTSTGSLVDDDGLVDFLKGKKKVKGESMKKFNENVDFFGIPLMEDSYKPGYDAVKDADIIPADPEAKDKEVEKAADDLSTKEQAIKHVGDSIAPAAQKEGGKEHDEKELDASKIKVGDVGDDHGDVVKGDGKSDDQQKDVPANKIKVGDVGDLHGKHVEEHTERKRPVKMESTALIMSQLGAITRRLGQIEESMKSWGTPKKMESKSSKIDDAKAKMALAKQRLEAKRMGQGGMKKESKSISPEARKRLQLAMKNRKK